MPPDSLHKRLRQLVGSRFHYAGERWTLIEVLADSDALVLQHDSAHHRPVQPSLYGAPVRRSPETLTLPISGPDGAYSAEVADLLRGRVVG